MHIKNYRIYINIFRICIKIFEYKLQDFWKKQRFTRQSQRILAMLLLFPFSKWTWTFIWTNLNPLNPRMLLAKFGCNWSSGSGEEGRNCEKFTTTTTTTTDNGKISIKTSHLNLPLRWVTDITLKRVSISRPWQHGSLFTEIPIAQLNFRSLHSSFFSLKMEYFSGITLISNWWRGI